MEILAKIESYEIKPFDKFCQVTIIGENGGFRIGLGYDNMNSSFWVFKNVIIGSLSFLNYAEHLETFVSLEECEEYLKGLTLAKFKIEFEKGKAISRRHLLAIREHAK